MFRREWRQQLLVMALLTTAVAASVALASAAYSMTPVRGNAQFGAASHLITFSGNEPQTFEAEIAAVGKWFDSYEVIYHRQVPAPGLFEPVDYRGQVPDGPLSGPRLALLAGTYPAAGQVAITDGIAEILGVNIGASLALDGMSRTVVGMVENPGDLADEFVLVQPSDRQEADEVTILVDSSEDHLQAFRVSGDTAVSIGSRMANEDVLAAVSVLVFESIGLLLITLIATASFVVIAHRRMRQLGMLAAIGATQRQLRLVTLTNGTLIGIVAAVIGAATGFAAWVTVASLVEDTVGYRVNELHVPLWIIAAGMLLAVIAGTAAAWWPARNVARVPTVRALSGRPPAPRPARRSAALAVVSAAIGVTCLVIGGDLRGQTTVNWTEAVLIVAGTVTVGLAMLLAAPIAIRLLAASVGRFPVAMRLAIGDLVRYRARSGAALAAISLPLGIAVAIVASASAAQAGAEEGNLPATHVMIRTEREGPFIPAATDLDRLQKAADRVAASFGSPRMTTLEVALDPGLAPDPAYAGRQAITIAKRDRDGWLDVSLVYVATPQLLAYYGYQLEAVPPGAVVITRETGEFVFIGDARQADRSHVKSPIELAKLNPGHGSLPGTFVTTAEMNKRGWVAAPSGRWLLELSTAPTTEQIAAARQLAAGADLTIEVRDPQTGLGSLRSGATAAGILVALGVIGMTVGLLRTEGRRDLHILTAIGATRRTRRNLTAATAGGLAVLGTLLGTAGAYIGLAAGFARDLEELTPVPIMHLAIIVVGLPLIATAAGWLASGRAATDIARQPMQ